MSNATKVCTRCKTEKQLTDYYKQKTGKNGLYSHCKTCHSKYSERYRNSERYRKKRAEYRATDAGKKAQEKYQAKYRKRDVRVAWQREYDAARRETEVGKRKENARYQVRAKIKLGEIERPENCSNCNVKCKPDFHHTDTTYQPENDLVGVWVCRPCHYRAHQEIKDAVTSKP